MFHRYIFQTAQMHVVFIIFLSISIRKKNKKNSEQMHTIKIIWPILGVSLCLTLSGKIARCFPNQASHCDLIPGWANG